MAEMPTWMQAAKQEHDDQQAAIREEDRRRHEVRTRGLLRALTDLLGQEAMEDMALDVPDTHTSGETWVETATTALLTERRTKAVCDLSVEHTIEYWLVLHWSLANKKMRVSLGGGRYVNAGWLERYRATALYHFYLEAVAMQEAGARE